MHLPEAQLVKLAQQGDRAALGTLLNHHHQRLFNVALRMLGHHEDAAEVTQDAMLKIVGHIKNYDGRSQLTTWMIRIVMNLSISHLRKRKLRRTASLDADSGNGGGPIARGDGNDAALRDRLVDDRERKPDERVQHEEMIAELHRALGRLDEEFRSVLVLRDMNDMDYEQIADALSVPVGTVKSRLFRARLALRQEMLKAFPDADVQPAKQS